ncbi:MAG TPA: ankyrin repeat domain-containing protein [Bdellovibrionota bacterium]|jgi:ankyrin repeat protein|nr:ankyrin repeat domain-containing protein [Bdellovibrionota bacterium]
MKFLKLFSILLVATIAHAQEAPRKFESPLNAAIWNSNKKEVERLLNAKASRFTINAAESDGSVPLHVAAEKNNPEVVAKLLELGATVDKANKAGATPLSTAIEHNSVEVARLLMAKKPMIFTAGNSGQNVLHLLAQRMLTQPDPFDSKTTKLFVDLVRLGADHGDHYVDPVSRDKIFPLTILEKKFGAKDKTYLAFVKSVEDARKAYRAEAGVTEEPGEKKPPVKPAPTPKAEPKPEH